MRLESQLWIHDLHDLDLGRLRKRFLDQPLLARGLLVHMLQTVIQIAQSLSVLCRFHRSRVLRAVHIIASGVRLVDGREVRLGLDLRVKE